jgi:threonine synthase
MICVSTRGAAPPVPFRQALLAGLAPDGGLYVPAAVSPIAAGHWSALRGGSLADTAVAILAHLIGDEIPRDALRQPLAEALDFPVPLVGLDDRLTVLELFHGPTLAFKDVGARVFARLLALLDDGVAPITVLVATSGDTGGAVARAFSGVANTRVVVLYPDGLVSPVQEAQFTTLGGNVTALAVEGTFDDCQRLVKAAFSDEALRQRCRLTSANSISLGRLLPQIIYYAHAVVQMTDRLPVPDSPSPVPVTIVVPSGNFGNLTAGVMASRLGAPIARFMAATTINDTVPRYLDTGVVSPRPSVRTLANAMDVGDPSNLERLKWLFDGDVAAMRALIGASVHTDDEVREAIRELDRRYGYVADPHTAIAYLGARDRPAFARLSPDVELRRVHHRGPSGRDGGEPRTGDRVIFLATAHPGKFREVVEPAIGRELPLPPALAAMLALPRQFGRIPATAEALKAELVALEAG